MRTHATSDASSVIAVEAQHPQFVVVREVVLDEPAVEVAPFADLATMLCAVVVDMIECQEVHLCFFAARTFVAVVKDRLTF